MEDKKIQERWKLNFFNDSRSWTLSIKYSTYITSICSSILSNFISQKGVSTVNNVSLVDIDSDLMNINRKLTLDPSKKYSPDENKDDII